MKVFAVIPTAGTGERFGSVRPKPLVELCDRPVIAHTLNVFEKSEIIAGVVLVAHAEYRNEYASIVDRYGLRKVLFIENGGGTRTQSVRNGLRVVPSGVDYVVVHDGVRPLLSLELLRQGVEAAIVNRAAIAAVPSKSALKVVDLPEQLVCETLDRSLIWEVQTPQVFERVLLDQAYAGDEEALDDAALVEKCGVRVKVFLGDYKNIKITTIEDLLIARAFLQAA